MLARTASDLYWMARYMERAGNLARLLNEQYALSMFARHDDGIDELLLPLRVSGLCEQYLQLNPQPQADTVIAFLLLERDIPGSIMHSLACAHACAHALRGSVAADLWEGLNSTWLEARTLLAQGTPTVGQFCDWLKQRVYQFRGTAVSTCLLHEGLAFIQLGGAVERADYTIRLLDSRYRFLSSAGGSTRLDHHQWSALLRALSAFEHYTERYGGQPNLNDFSELMLYGRDHPHALLCCVESIAGILTALPGDNGRAAKRQALELLARVRYGVSDDVLAYGLAQWCNQHTEYLRQLTEAIEHAYLELQ